MVTLSFCFTVMALILTLIQILIIIPYPACIFMRFIKACIQVSPIAHWSGCTNPDRVIGKARSSFRVEWSDLINVDICMGHTYSCCIYTFGGIYLKNDNISCIIYLNKRTSTNVIVLSLNSFDVLFLQYIH